VKGATAPATNPWVLLCAAAGGLGMIMIDAAGTSVALPAIQRGLDLNQGAQQWIITVYALTLAAMIPTGGKLADVFGRARVFSIGVVFFGTGSVVCGLAVDFPMLLTGRVIEGLGNIMMAPSAALLAAEAFGPNARGKSMGIYSGLGGLAMIAGALIEHFGWRAVFFINPPIAVATLILLRIARPVEQSEEKGKLNPLHSFHLALSLTLLVLGLQQSHSWGWTSPTTLSLIAGGLILLAGFVMTQLRAADPLVDVRLLTKRQFAGNSLVLFCAQFSTVGQSAYSAIYLQRVLHLSPMQAGLSMLLFLGPLMIAAPLSGRLYDRFGIRLPAVLGLGMATVGIFLQSQALPHCSFPPLIPALILIGAGLGLSMSQTYTDGTALVERRQAGQAFGALDTLRQLGGAIGMAAIGTVVVANEKVRLNAIAASHAPEGAARDHLLDLMAQAAYGQPAAIETVRTQWPDIINALRMDSAQSIADGFYLGGTVMALGLIGAALLLKGKPRATSSRA
jgi:EmrB/QacA subfamily drug resistance transporter